ncbi:MAG: hypothetical protein AAGA18_08270 [Verrucomicrobiota bacterium]
MGKKDARYLLKKTEDGNTIGPLTKEGLKELAQSARVAPDDEVALTTKQNIWQPAPNVDFLEMNWLVPRGENSTGYGPTTLGTLHEFLIAGEITAEHLVEHKKTGQKKKIIELVEVLTDKQIKVRNEAKESNPPTLKNNDAAHAVEEVLETARQLRIRQLAHDLDDLTKKHDALLQKFRKLSVQLAQKK